MVNWNVPQTKNIEEAPKVLVILSAFYVCQNNHATNTDFT